MRSKIADTISYFAGEKQDPVVRTAMKALLARLHLLPLAVLALDNGFSRPALGFNPWK